MEIERCHVLDGSSIPGRAFAEALSRLVDTALWLPERHLFVAEGVGRFFRSPGEVAFTLQRGYQYPLVDRLLEISHKLHQGLVSQTNAPRNTALICTSPYWVPVAEMWAGPVIYYSLDFTYAYDGCSPERILALERRLCKAAICVFPVSARIENYLVHRAGCAATKITVLPNATRSENLQTTFERGPARRPRDLQHIKQPIAGIIGNMSDNIDWLFLREAISRSTGIHWVFVGPADSKIRDAQQSRARQEVMRSEKALFLGARPYRDLQAYARALDVAILPYRRKEPTYSGSATRYYEHLAAGRPMFATPNVAELEQKRPFVCLVETAEGLVRELARLRECGFRDGLEEARVKASREETWDVRAAVMLSAMRAAIERKLVSGTACGRARLRSEA